MLSCKEITKLVSQSLDEPLPWRKRMEVWMHLNMCRLCSAFRRDQRELRERMTSERQGDAGQNADSQPGLSPEAKKRIKSVFDSQLP